MHDPAMPPLDFLLDASLTSLHDLELAALNRSANLGKATKTELCEWIEQSAIAMLARWMIENREALLSTVDSSKKEEFEELFETPKHRKSA